MAFTGKGKMSLEEILVSMAKNANIHDNDFREQAAVFAVHNHVHGEIVQAPQTSQAQPDEETDKETGNKKTGNVATDKRPVDNKTLIDKVRETTVGEILDTVRGIRGNKR